MNDGMLDTSNKIDFEDVDYDSIDSALQKKSKNNKANIYKLIYENAPIAFVFWDNDYKITDWNKKAESLFGWKKSEVLGKNFFDFLIPKDEKIQVKNIVTSLLKNKLPNHNINKNITKEGKHLIVEWKNSIQHDENNNIIGAISLGLDITEIVKSKEKLEESREHFKNLFNCIADPIVIVDSKGVFLDINKSVTEITGYSKDELVGTNFLRAKLVTPDSKKLLLKNLLKRMIGVHVKPYEVEIISKNDSIIPFEINAAKMSYKNRAADLVVFRDVSARKKAEQTVRESEEQFRMISEQSLMGIVIIQGEDIIYVNEQVENIIEYSKSELLDGGISLISKIIHPDDAQFVLDQLEKKLAGVKNVETHYSYRIISKSGVVKWIDQYSKTVLFKGENADFINIVDITNIKKAEKELKKTHLKLKELNQELEKKVSDRTYEIQKLLKQKDEFINQLGHDLKNPLNPLINLIPVLSKDEKDDTRREMFEVINRNVNYMKNLVIKTVELARLNSPNTKFHFEDVILTEEVNKVIDENMFLFKNKHIEIENRVPMDIKVKLDRLRIEELFTNLLNNAVKYSNDFGKIDIDAMFMDDDTIKVTITDNGIGMDDEQLGHIFEEFYKADYSRHDFDSSGLGMSICKRIIERHGGKIWVDSPGIGKGTSFHFTLSTFFHE